MFVSTCFQRKQVVKVNTTLTYHHLVSKQLLISTSSSYNVIIHLESCLCRLMNVSPIFTLFYFEKLCIWCMIVTLKGELQKYSYSEMKLNGVFVRIRAEKQLFFYLCTDWLMSSRCAESFSLSQCRTIHTVYLTLTR